jgi:hypothetical protein
MIKVIGEPKLWRGFRNLKAAGQKALGEYSPERLQSRLVDLIATPLIAPKPRSYKDVVPGEPQSCKEQLCDPAVSRGSWMIGRL